MTLPRRILIANRGEIAVRVIAACRELGIEAAAIYSDADAGALHVRLADLALPIGGQAGAESYLRIDRVIEAARRSDATAIHPGYGFLSENPAFAEACAAAGIVFIGPPPEAMRLLGNKVSAKALAEEVGVPVVPGYRGADQAAGTLAREADRIGYPVLIKAAAGGGGRGMRVVREAGELAGAVEAAAREAQAAFGSGQIFLERYIERPRHVEVQVLGDRHGTVLALGERECSVQRRHQKVIEEAPSPVVDEALRGALCEAAVRLARAAGYVNAGTVEFLLDVDRRFYFLEMNTRLQVEHPVTELVTGLDLVAAQIRIAAGEPLPSAWQVLRPRGHAVEARLYAEDPGRGFVPATGTVRRFELPFLPDVRIDTGVAAGDAVGVHYDPLLAKVIAHGDGRGEALARLRHALDRIYIGGLTTNLSYLRAILDHPAFVAGDLSTRFLDEHQHELLRPPEPPGELVWAAAALVMAGVRGPDTLAPDAPDPRGSWQGQKPEGPWDRPDRKRPWQGRDPEGSGGVRDYARAYMDTREGRSDVWRALGVWRHRAAGVALTLEWHGERRRIALLPDEGDWYRLADPSQPLRVRLEQSGSRLHLSTGDGRHLHGYGGREGDGADLEVDGVRYHFRLAEAPESAGRGHGRAGGTGLEAPMPGVLVKVHVREGQAVAAHQPLLVLEAMKMEHVIAAPSAGVVRRLPFAAGALVPAGATLVELDEAGPS